MPLTSLAVEAAKSQEITGHNKGIPHTTESRYTVARLYALTSQFQKLQSPQVKVGLDRRGCVPRARDKNEAEDDTAENSETEVNINVRE